jgi:hypothetical protein
MTTDLHTIPVTIPPTAQDGWSHLAALAAPDARGEPGVARRLWRLAHVPLRRRGTSDLRPPSLHLRHRPGDPGGATIQRRRPPADRPATSPHAAPTGWCRVQPEGPHRARPHITELTHELLDATDGTGRQGLRSSSAPLLAERWREVATRAGGRSPERGTTGGSTRPPRA